MAVTVHRRWGLGLQLGPLSVRQIIVQWLRKHREKQGRWRGTAVDGGLNGMARNAMTVGRGDGGTGGREGYRYDRDVVEGKRSTWGGEWASSTS